MISSGRCLSAWGGDDAGDAVDKFASTGAPGDLTGPGFGIFGVVAVDCGLDEPVQRATTAWARLVG
jgi:hypothetical protein